MFCNQCGFKYSENSKYCPSCGVLVPNYTSEQLCPSAKSDTIKLSLFRTSQIFLINPPMNATLNGEHFSIANGERKDFILPIGSHELTLSMGIRTKTYDIDLDTNTTIIIKMNRITGCIEIDIE